jgi:hypothetical protein
MASNRSLVLCWFGYFIVLLPTREAAQLSSGSSIGEIEYHCARKVQRECASRDARASKFQRVREELPEYRAGCQSPTTKVYRPSVHVCRQSNCQRPLNITSPCCQIRCKRQCTCHLGLERKSLVASECHPYEGEDGLARTLSDHRGYPFLQRHTALLPRLDRNYTQMTTGHKEAIRPSPQLTSCAARS